MLVIVDYLSVVILNTLRSADRKNRILSLQIFNENGKQ